MECMEVNASSEAFIVVMFQVDIFWIVTPCSVVVGHLCFRDPCFLNVEGEVTRIGRNDIETQTGEGQQVLLVNRKCEGSDLTASAY
jgi:hypothetical protein